MGLCIESRTCLSETRGSLRVHRISETMNDFPQCVGLGLICGINLVSKTFLIATPVPEDRLHHVNCLVKSYESLPSIFVNKSPLTWYSEQRHSVLGDAPMKSRGNILRPSSLIRKD